MKTKDIRAQLEAGVSVFARRPVQGDTELEIITVEKVDRGYVTGSSTKSRKTRWPVALISPLKEAEATIERWARDHRKARRARREAAELQAKIYDLLDKIGTIELPYGGADVELYGPGSGRVVHVSMSLHDLRKLTAALSLYVSTKEAEK